jgi:hypothetical protein
MRFFKNIQRLIVLLAILGFSSQQSYGQSNFYKLHALFLYNFTKHIQWNGVGETFRIGVYASDNAVKVLKESLAGKKYGSKTIEVITVNNTSEVNNCQLIYLPKSNKGKIAGLVEASNKSNRLFVSEDDMIADGVSISFVIKESRLNFKISKSRVDQAGLKVSSALLSLGEVVD